MDRAAPKCRGCGRELILRTIEEREGLCRRDHDTEWTGVSRGCHASFTGFVRRKFALLPMRKYTVGLFYGRFYKALGIDFEEPTAQVLLDEWLEQRITTSP